jgi:hypothetical protein
MFLSGRDVPEATDHDLAAIVQHPESLGCALTYQNATQKESEEPRNWYGGLSPCIAPLDPGNQCDEYPFWATEQGGGMSVPRPSLRQIDGDQNMLQGSHYSGFLTRCGVSVDDHGTRSGCRSARGAGQGRGTATLLVAKLHKIGERLEAEAELLEVCTTMRTHEREALEGLRALTSPAEQRSAA